MQAKSDKTAASNNEIAQISPLKEHRIGVKLKHARIMRGLRLKNVAEQAACSESLISKIENGHANPSVAMLHKITTVLGINIGHLFATLDNDESLIQRKGERPVITTGFLRQGNGVALERLIPNANGNLLQGAIHIIEPGGESDGDLKHEGEEVGYVLEGKLELKVEGQIYTVNADDSFYFSSDLLHSYRNISDGVTRILWINTPPTF